MTSPNLATTGITSDRFEGFTDIGEASLNLDLPDREVIDIIGRQVEMDVAYWNDKLDLDNIREQNEKFWTGEYIEDEDLYTYEEKYRYMDPRIWMSIETNVANIIARPAEPVVTPAHNTDASRQLADDFQKVWKHKYTKDWHINEQLKIVARHLFIGYRIGILKYYFDPNIGPRSTRTGKRLGDIVVEAKLPSRIVLAAGARDPLDVPRITEYKSDTIEVLGFKFPDKREQILREMAITNTDHNFLGREVKYLETCFTYYDKSTGERREGIAWRLKNLLLGKIKNPNWNYNETRVDEEGRLVFNNFLDHPVKPYILFNFLRLGKYALDDTSYTEKAQYLQKQLDRRGKQVSHNADLTNVGGKVFDATAVEESDVQELVGDPLENIMVAGDVRRAFQKSPPDALPDYVVAEKIDHRNEIDNVFSTHAPLRGEASNLPTLGQELISQRSDIARGTSPAMAIEDGVNRLYQHLTQMMKVFYTEEHVIRYTGESGQTSFITFKNDKIEDGMEISVAPGSLLPDDANSRRIEAIELSKANKIDPLTMAEDMGRKNPREYAMRLVLFTMDPNRYLQEVLRVSGPGTIDQEAIQHISLLNEGQDVPPEQNPSKEHLAAHTNYLRSPDFTKLPPEVQQNHKVHVRQELRLVRAGMREGTSGPGAPGEVKPNPVPGIPEDRSVPASLMDRVRNTFGGLLRGGGE